MSVGGSIYIYIYIKFCVSLVTPLKPTDCPQEITIDWELETPDGGGGEENEKKLIFTKRVNR